ncbi:MAG: RAMP superfamily CRISPR-associated protein [Promethearchaeota archaeon]
MSKIVNDTFKSLDRIFKFDLIITTNSPLLIRGAEKKFSVSDNDMEFIRNEQDKIYIPGSSLKGFFRINSERLINSLNGNVCDIITNSCGKKYEKSNKKFDPKKHILCDTCELFGSEGLSSRIFFEDSYLKSKPIFDRRVGIAINRKSQSVRHGPFTFETLIENSIFSLNGIIRKFTLTDLAIFQLVRAAVNKKLIQIGAFKSKGYGLINISIDENNNKNQIIIIGSEKENIIYANYIKFFNKSSNEFYLPLKRDSISNNHLISIKINDAPIIQQEIPGIFEINLSKNSIDQLLSKCLEIYIENLSKGS